MAGAEKAGARRDRVITPLEKVTGSHSSHLIVINRYLEDLENRGRVRGVHESVKQDKIVNALQSIFNNLLERPADTPRTNSG